MPSPRDFPHPQALLASNPMAPEAGASPGSPANDRAAAAKLASAEQTLRDISHAFAHDLRTSLRHVSSYAQMLGDPAYAGQPEQAARLAHKVLEASRRLQHLMASVSALARLQPHDLQPETVDTAELVRSLIREMDAGSSGRRVACVVAPDLPPARADAALLRRVWQELLDNAWRHAREHAQPRIDIRHEAVPGGHAYLVCDNGQGFEPAKAAELFGLFRRSVAEPAHGLGVGLAMVRRIVECHGGRVWASVQPGQGACFGFSLPASG